MATALIPDFKPSAPPVETIYPGRLYADEKGFVWRVDSSYKFWVPIVDQMRFDRPDGPLYSVPWAVLDNIMIIPGRL